MIHKVLIPQAFENMEEATIGKWLRQEGEAVRENDALCELITEKTTFDLPAENVPQGEIVLRRIVATEKSIVPVGYCIAILGEAGEELPEVDADNAALLANRQVSGSEDALKVDVDVPRLEVRAPGGASAGSRVRATPAARRAAKDKGVAIEDVAAAFPGKVLTEEDVAAFQG